MRASVLRIIAFGCLLTAISVAWIGCGDSESDADGAGSTAEETRQSAGREETAPKQDPSPGKGTKSGGKPKQQSPAQAAGFGGQYESNFETALFACGNYGLKEMIEAFELPPNAEPVEVAKVYSEGFEGPRFELAAQEGCLEGLEGR